MKIRRTSPRPPGATHPLQLAGFAALMVVLAAALTVAAVTGKL
nr:hypothetical protein [Rhodococcus sp. (in: high G+C Gram-positive bacteria)]